MLHVKKTDEHNIKGSTTSQIMVYPRINKQSTHVYIYMIYIRAVACGGSPPQNFPNFVKFLGKMAAMRKFCIVGENLAPQTKSPGYGPVHVINRKTHCGKRSWTKSSILSYCHTYYTVIQSYILYILYILYKIYNFNSLFESTIKYTGHHNFLPNEVICQDWSL